MLIVRHPNRHTEGRASVARALAILCPSLTLGQIAEALRRVRTPVARRPRAGQGTAPSHA